MKTITYIGFGVSIFAVITLVYAQFPGQSAPAYNPLISWTSKNATDPITIQNGTGVAIFFTITVDASSAGINIKNCGTTTHINAGSSGICYTKDPNNPITFASDNVSLQSSGSYIIKQQQY